MKAHIIEQVHSFQTTVGQIGCLREWILWVGRSRHIGTAALSGAGHAGKGTFCIYEDPLPVGGALRRDQVSMNFGSGHKAPPTGKNSDYLVKPATSPCPLLPRSLKRRNRPARINT